MNIDNRKTIEIENKSLKVWLGKAVCKTNRYPSLTWAITSPYAGSIMLWSADGYRMHCDVGDYEDNCKIEYKKSIDTTLNVPDFTPIISRKYNYRVYTNVNDLMQGLKLFKKKSLWDYVDMTFNDDEITLYSENDSDDNIEHIVSMQNNPRYMAQNVTFKADPRYMLDALSGFNKRDKVSLQFNGYDNPMLIGNLDSRFAIVMPMMKAR